MKLTLAENIRIYRKERRLTQQQFAEALGGNTLKFTRSQGILIEFIYALPHLLDHNKVLSTSFLN